MTGIFRKTEKNITDGAVKNSLIENRDKDKSVRVSVFRRKNEVKKKTLKDLWKQVIFSRVKNMYMGI